jgi:hypothetical protein
MITVRQLVPMDAVGRTHASSVRAPLRRSDAESETVTQLLDPLNESALPLRPAVVHAAFEIVPVLPFPDASLTVVPAPSLNEYAATSPGIVASVVALATFEYGPRFPAASVARTR